MIRYLLEGVCGSASAPAPASASMALEKSVILEALGIDTLYVRWGACLLVGEAIQKWCGFEGLIGPDSTLHILGVLGLKLYGNFQGLSVPQPKL